MNAEVKRWIEFARTDYSVAAHLNDLFYPKPYEIICYHCQQSAEKAIKALIISLQFESGLPQKHDISFLLDQIKNSVDIPEECYDCADTLTPYCTSARYPSELFIDEKKVTEALSCSEKLILWAENEINKSEGTTK